MHTEFLLVMELEKIALRIGSTRLTPKKNRILAGHILDLMIRKSQTTFFVLVLVPK
jgi:hypothetical protein